MATSADGSRLFVGNANNNTVSIIQTATNRQIDVMPVFSNPFGLAVTPDTRRLYITFIADNQVGVYDLLTKRQLALIPVPDGPYRIAMHPNGSRVYVTSADGTSLVVIDTASNRVIRNITLGIEGTGIAISPDGSRVFVSTVFPGPLLDEGPGAIWAIDTRRNEVIGSIRGFFEDPLAISPDGRLLYALSYEFGLGLVTLQTEPLAVLKTSPLDPVVLAMALSPTGSSLYLVYSLDNVTKVFDLASDSIVATIPTGNFPIEVAIPAPRPVPRPVYPFAVCVQRGTSGFRAVFGYFNENEVGVNIPAGPDNGFTPAPENRGQVTSFARGVILDAFRVSFDGNPLTWTLTGPDGETRKAVASRNSLVCPF